MMVKEGRPIRNTLIVGSYTSADKLLSPGGFLEDAEWRDATVVPRKDRTGAHVDHRSKNLVGPL